jgi:hypothetical protein
LVATFKVGVGMDLIRQRWNEAGWRINPLFNTRVRWRKKVYLKTKEILPPMPALWWHLKRFLDCVKNPPPKPPSQPLFSGPIF